MEVWTILADPEQPTRKKAGAGQGSMRSSNFKKRKHPRAFFLVVHMHPCLIVLCTDMSLKLVVSVACK